MRFFFESITHRKAWRYGLLCGMGWSGIVWGQAPAVESLKKGYEEEVSKTVQPLRESYRKALLAQETELASKGDYAGARLVQEERKEVERLSGWNRGASSRIGPATEENGMVKLGVAGEGGGGLRAEGGAWTGWQAEGGFIRWPLPAGLRAGGYAMELVYASSRDATMGMAVRENFHTLSRVVKLPAAPAAGVPEGRVKLGTLRLRAGASLLELKVTAAGTAPDFRLFELRLILEEGGA